MIYFVSGIDTDIGKSYATGWLAKTYQDQGQRVITQKFVQTGCDTDISEDIVRHRQLMGCGFFPEDDNRLTMPEMFTYPCSPHMAAVIDQREIDFGKIERATKILDERYDVVLLEGAGGLMVPLTERYLTIDYIQDHAYPLILVTSGKLGSINQTLLSLEAIQRRNIPLKALIYNAYPMIDARIEAETATYLKTVLCRDFPLADFLHLPICER